MQRYFPGRYYYDNLKTCTLPVYIVTWLQLFQNPILSSSGAGFAGDMEKLVMFRTLITAIALTFLLASCAASRKPVPDTSLECDWTLAVFPYQNKTLAEVFGTRVVTLLFTKATGTVSGTTGCNRFTCHYTASTDSLLFSQNRALTKMACPDYEEQLFLNGMDRVNRYRINEGQLELLQNDVIVMIFARKS